jgi:hypothetical protein
MKRGRGLAVFLALAGCGGTVHPGAAPDAAASDSGDPDAGVAPAPPMDATTNDEAGDDAASAGQPRTFAMNDCPGDLPADVVAALEQGGPVAPGMALLYPYDGTVFPTGLPAPVLQWTPASSGSAPVYVHLHSTLFDYQGCFTSSGGQLTLPRMVWAETAAFSRGPSDPVAVELTTGSPGAVSGPLRESWILATGPLPGAVYYDTYGSSLAANEPKGAVLKLVPGAAQPSSLLSGPCVSCHAVAANGSYLAAEEELFPGANPLYGKGSMSFDLGTPPDPGAPLASTTADNWALGALTPDGSRLLTSGQPADSSSSSFPSAAGNVPGMPGPRKSAMYDPATGAALAFTGLTAQYAMMPAFSPDGAHVAYNDYDATSGHTLTVMDFAAASNHFSNAVAAYHDTALFPGWPAFTPDDRAVVFALGDGDDFATDSPPAATPTHGSQLYAVPAGGGDARRLDAATGTTDYYPSLGPVASGGYFWLVFTSRRPYGNLDAGSKALWVAAIDIEPAAGADPSHPAFYLPGQQLGAGNFRGTAALDVCAPANAACGNGWDCCDHSCITGKCAVNASCSAENNGCSPTVKCCNPDNVCINGYCAWIARR